MTRARLLAVGVAAAALAGAGAARADLSAEAEMVTAAWLAHGDQARRLPPLFVEHGRARAVSLPASAYDGTRTGCTSVAFLTGRSTDFVVRVDPMSGGRQRASSGQVERSVAGTVLLVRCGPARASLARASLELRTARATVEVIVAEGEAPTTPVATVLPERASGPVAPPGDPGPSVMLEPIEVRATRAEVRAKRGGASAVRRKVVVADMDGTGREVLSLEEGCHRVELFAEPGARRRVDLDAELRDVTTERLLARDRADSADARLEVCVGETSGVDLHYAGAPGAVPVLVTDSRYPIPIGVPAHWGGRARAGMAAAMRRRALPTVRGTPFFESLGVTGVTVVPLEVEPGTCYVAVLGAMRGEARAMLLTARTGPEIASDSNGGIADGTAVAFCASRPEPTRLEVEVRGNAVAWALAIWSVGTRSLEATP